jgi:hypothetical protein
MERIIRDGARFLDLIYTSNSSSQRSTALDSLRKLIAKYPILLRCIIKKLAVGFDCQDFRINLFITNVGVL